MKSCKSTGFTLMEMTIAMTIMAVTGLAVAGVAMAISKANSDTDNYYQSIQTGRSAIMKIQNVVQNSKLVTYCSTLRIILWMEDTNGDGDINIDEIGVLEFSTDKIILYRLNFPSGLGALLNLHIPVNDMVSVGFVSQILTNQYVTSTVLAEDVSSCKFVASPSPPYTKLVRIQMSIGSGPQALTLRTAASTRASATRQVGWGGGGYVLVPN